MNANELIEKVKEFEDTIANLTEQVGGFKKQLENIEAAEEKKFKRVEMDVPYYTIDFEERKLIVEEVVEQYEEYDDNSFNNNNYFLMEERAQEVVKYLNKIMCVERVRDEYPDVKIKINVDIDASNYDIPISVEIFRRYKELLEKTQ